MKTRIHLNCSRTKITCELHIQCQVDALKLKKPFPQSVHDSFETNILGEIFSYCIS